jgi:hypothetical protein
MLSKYDNTSKYDERASRLSGTIKIMQGRNEESDSKR